MKLKTALLLLCSAGMALLASATDLPTVLPSNVKIVKFVSASLGDERTMLVMLPVDYDTSVIRYPTLYLLHGYDADITDWARGTNLSAYAANHHLIIVTLDASRGWYVKSRWTRKRDSTTTLWKMLLDMYTNISSRSRSRSRARLRQCPWGGLEPCCWACRHRDRFAAIGSFSGALAAVACRAPPLARECDGRGSKTPPGICGAGGRTRVEGTESPRSLRDCRANSRRRSPDAVHRVRGRRRKRRRYPRVPGRAGQTPYSL